MEKALTTAAKSKKGAPTTPDKQPIATIVHREPRVDLAKEAHLAGTYRVIHGRLVVPRPSAELLGEDGQIDHSKVKTEIAVEGDIVELGDADAYRMLAMDRDEEVRHMHAVVERLDARPSRLGKGFQPPKAVVNNWVAIRGSGK